MEGKGGVGTRDGLYRRRKEVLVLGSEKGSCVDGEKGTNTRKRGKLLCRRMKKNY